MEPQTTCHLIVKEKVAEEIILGKYCNYCSYNEFAQQSQFQSSYYSAVQCATGLQIYYLIAHQKLDE